MTNMLIPLDGSQQSEAVLPVALTLARECGYEPILLAVWETGAEEPPESARPEIVEMTDHGTECMRSYLHTVAPRVDEMGLAMTLEVRAGHPAVEIISAAQDRQADMIAMCTHGRRAVPGGRRGSVADKVLRGATVPVLAIGPLVAPREADGVLIRRVLVPLDGSPDAEEALAPALELARGLGAAIGLLRIVTPAAGHFAEQVPGEVARKLDKQREKLAVTYLEKLRQAHGEPIESVHVAVGFPAEAIESHVEQSGADLVVMTSHSRYAAGLWTLGGIADALLDGPAPVLLVRPSTA
jgi:nucleotide-binding universal stress UspA family protein